MGEDWDAGGTRPYRIRAGSETGAPRGRLAGTLAPPEGEFQVSSWKSQGAGCFQWGDDFNPNPKTEIRRPKSEGRNPRAERNPKADDRNPKEIRRPMAECRKNPKAEVRRASLGRQRGRTISVALKRFGFRRSGFFRDSGIRISDSACREWARVERVPVGSAGVPPAGRQRPGNLPSRRRRSQVRLAGTLAPPEGEF